MTRTTKQVVYGSLYASFWLLCIFGFYVVFLKPAPSCTDGLRNQDEVEVDCGGQFCVSCEIKKLAPFQILPVQLFATSDEKRTTVVVEARNPNTTYGAEHFVYDVIISAKNPDRVAYTERIDMPMYPGELKYRVIVNAPVPYADIIGATTTLVDVSAWRPVASFPKPRIPVRNIKTTVVGNRMMVTGSIQNENPFALRRVNISAFIDLPGQGTQTVSKTVVNDLLVAEERGFQVVFPLPAGMTGGGTLEPRLVVDAER